MRVQHPDGDRIEAGIQELGVARAELAAQAAMSRRGGHCPGYPAGAIRVPRWDDNAGGAGAVLPLRPRPPPWRPPSPSQQLVQSITGPTMDANADRARFKRDFTVPRLQCVISAMSS